MTSPTFFRSVPLILVSLVLLAAASAACWWGWMAWDDTYQVDPKTGYDTGPYEAWQVIGCAVCLIAIGVVASLRLRFWLVAPVMTLAFTVAWSRTAAETDETGLWAVGAFMLLVGMGTVSLLLALLVNALAQRRQPPATVGVAR